MGGDTLSRGPMSDLSDQRPRLEEQLREIDRRLRMIRAGLDPAPPASNRPPLEQAGSPRAGPLSEALGRLHELGRIPPDAGLAALSRPDADLDPSRPDADLRRRSGLPAQLGRLRDLQSALTELEARVGEVISACREALARALEMSGEPFEPDGDSATVIAGPFATPAQVREFEALLGELSPVEEVRLAGYEAEDRAVLEVRLRPRREQ